jgi:hypothetical protein
VAAESAGLGALDGCDLGDDGVHATDDFRDAVWGSR